MAEKMKSHETTNKNETEVKKEQSASDAVKEGLQKVKVLYTKLYSISLSRSLSDLSYSYFFLCVVLYIDSRPSECQQ